MEEKKCCSHAHNEEKHSEDGCCCHKEQNAEKSCSCHAEHHEEHSCCSHKEEEHSCCSHKEEQGEHSCCSHKEEERSCCSHESEAHSCSCHHHEEKEEHSCSCHHEDKEEHSCCCGSHHHEEEETCSCCGVAKKSSSSSCCGATKKSDSINVWWIIGFSAICTILSYINLWGDTVGILRLLDPGLIAVLLCGLPIYKGAVINLVKRKKITSALLISVALTASLIMAVLYGLGVLHGNAHHESYFFVAAEISVIMAIGEAIEDITTKKSNSAIEALMKIAPDTALVLRNGEYVELPVREVLIGDTVMIKPNTNISVDGVVIGGQSSVNQANLTGESIPVYVSEGSSVRAGTLNIDGALTVRVSALSKDSLVSKLAEYVKNAEKNKSPTVQLANRWAGYIVPGAIVCSILVFIVCLAFMGLDALVSMERAITILVVFCPCALGLSVPTAVAAAIGCGSRNGALIKNGRAMEELASISLIAFDKTGTLTEGKVKVSSLRSVGKMDEKELLRLSASLEASSEHPLALAVCEFAKANKIDYKPFDEVRSLVGMGASATCELGEVQIVSAKHAREVLGFDSLSANNSGETISCIAVNGRVEGVIAFTDTVRKDSEKTIKELKDLSVRTCMLTGDNSAVANAVCAVTGVDEVYSDLLPDDKARIIKQKQENGEKVAMIGDGVNDSMALSTADCSIAMGIMGNDVAIRSADVALMSDDMGKIPFLVRLSRKMKAKMHFNITISMIINVASVVLSALGILDAALGAIVHNCSSVLVCTNSALLLGFKDKK